MIIRFIKHFIKTFLFKRYWNIKGNFPYFNQKVYFPKDSIIFLRAVDEGIYENENVSIINQLTKKGTTILDIGANIGLMTIPLLSHHTDVEIISVEASPNSFPYLLKTKNQSSFDKRWKLVNKAVSNHVGKISFQLAGKGNAAYESILNTNRVDFVNAVEIECTTIDQIWHEHQKPKVSFIKIDIEGADLLALQGAKECIENCKPYILMEWNKTNIIPFGVGNIDLLKFAEERKYNIYVLPYFTKCTTIEDLNLFLQLSENFLLIPNSDNN